MKRAIFFLLFFTIAAAAYSQQQFTLSGTVRSERTGETIINASITSSGKGEGVSSNEYGFYSVTLPAGDYEITYSAVSHEPVTARITLDKDISKDIFLPDEMRDLENVTVSATGNFPQY